ncbi:hypothetical protein F7734_10020 [Scytonema sp. UIC 10036]|uniref:hypothetical protein n=1 Tax=Scytonema sp. UIC 10036 TaxID=2304196 RepID=UPI0012DA88E7|nr:hypothetical protein [Scytonema sp. UIC 10036]MUG92767.1 hypothetical protein [Scytonema sp. UIC 10036]
MKNTDCKLTADNFEYAVSLNALLVALFRFNGEKWEFVRTAKRSYGIAICHLEQFCGDDTLLVFPIGMLPDQIWDLLHRLENKN